MPNEKSLANLKPVKEGQVLNPEGRNQYTYRQEAERLLDQLLAHLALELAAVLEERG